MRASTEARIRDERRTGRKPILAPGQEDRMRKAAAEGVSRRDICARFGVSLETVSRVLRAVRP